MKYQIPKNYYFRLHHVRPRFKNDVENVLIYVATELSKLPAMPHEKFKKKVNEKIKMYPGNATKTNKTINNWRTEISSLFGLIEYDLKKGSSRPGRMALKLTENEDLVEFFKYFCFYFQYPGGHLKPHETKKLIEAGVKFKPVQFILKLLTESEKETSGRFGISKAEATHCILNDLRVTRGERETKDVLGLILENRKKKLDYDWTGDVIRYAGDILDYMATANLLTTHGNIFYLNHNEREAVTSILQNDAYFQSYDRLYGKKTIKLDKIKEFQSDWFAYVNNDLGKDLFKTDILKYLGVEETKYKDLVRSSVEDFRDKIGGEEKVRTKEVGDFGENLVFGHECMYLKTNDRKDLIRLVKRIPNAFAVGYDIQSVELDEIKKYIEVKTTISSKRLNFRSLHLTPNEWGTAESVGNRYFIYRLVVDKKDTRLFIIQDPVGQYKDSRLQMSPRNGADLIFDEKAGKWIKLLIWQE